MAQLAEEPTLTSALMIYTLNKDKEKVCMKYWAKLAYLLYLQVKVCVDVITKYITNIITNPTEDKFRKIRIQNKVA